MLKRVELGNPFQQGFRAAQGGFFDNPYPKNSEQHANWFFGLCIYLDGEDGNILAFQPECDYSGA